MENKKFELKPVVSEKSYSLANSQNKYTFLIEGEANKIEVAQDIEKKYKVKVIKVNSIVRPGKLRRDYKTYKKYRDEDITKVIVTLKKGDKIDEFLNV
ncbi:MAG: 50S ribosomal protein L23 [Candidatus Dojkabacteria bacterium]|nr:50S ribosomal protein L23 [Candidatus Dojkabacteria bacterium]